MSPLPQIVPPLTLAALLAMTSLAMAGEAPAQAPVAGVSRWFNPATAPFIPVPEIAVDPNGGTTLGVIPTWIHTDENHQIRRIIAPDVIHNANFGYGVHGRVYGYASGDEQWSLVVGIKQRVEREFDAEYQRGRLRQQRWSINASIIYDRDGTPRFYGIGNHTPAGNVSNYTNSQARVQLQAGLNLTHEWQLLYTARLQSINVLPGTLDGIASIERLYGLIPGVGLNKLFLNRVSLVYDTRDDAAVPSRGMQLTAYGSLASRRGVLNDSMYSEIGADGRAYWSVAPMSTLVAHVAVRYLPVARELPFWALSAIGGADSVIGGAQPLRGFGAGRYYDRDAVSGSLELRRKVWTFDATATLVDVEVTPFVDVGRVFARSESFSLSDLHHVFGLGFRAIARPFVVGYVDIGYGSEGIAAFSGLNYPF